MMRLLSRRRQKLSAACQSVVVEILENRCLLSLLGVVPAAPLVTYDSSGTLNYTAASGSLTVTATPLAIRFPNNVIRTIKQIPGDGRLVDMKAKVDSSGTLTGGVVGADLTVNGWIDMNNNNVLDAGDLSGTLLSGEVSQFGYQNSGTTDQYDFRFTPTGGLLFSQYFAGKDIGLLLASENSTFNGDFAVNFSGGAKGTLGAISPLLSSLSGYVYNDANNNGVFDPGELSITNAPINLTGTNVDGQVINLSTTTDANGLYNFTNLRPGTYSIIQNQLVGYLDGKDTIGTQGGTVSSDQLSVVLIAGVSGQNNNFGELTPSSLSGYVYTDSANDGSRTGDGGIAGVIVSLTGTDDLGNAVSFNTATDAGGLYSFGNLRPGTYVINESQPAGYLDGKDTIGTPGGTTGNDQFSNIVLNTGVNGTENNFGELLPASLGGYVYVDANNNGTYDSGEAAIVSATITLTGVDDLGNAVSLTTDSLADGSYSFTNLRPGTYILVENQPGGFLNGRNAVGTVGGNAVNDHFAGIVLSPDSNGQNYNFGELAPANLSGQVYVDANNNGVQDSGESAIAGVAITLIGMDDLQHVVNLTTTTDVSGQYTFSNLRPGTYIIAESQPVGYLDGKDISGTSGGTVGDDQFTSIALVAGANGQNYNFGELLPASLGGYVYSDANNNGSMDPGEVGIAGVAVNLTGADDLGQSVSLTTTTLADGAYIFTNLRPGTYSIAESQPVGYLDGKDTIGTSGGNAANDLFSNVVLTAGISGVNNNFGELAPASLDGFVWVDANNDGLIQPNETAIAGTTITLTGVNDLGATVTLTDTTDISGYYRFDNLRPGTYSITETQSAGYVDGKLGSGSLGGTASTNLFSNVVIHASDAGTWYDFAELVPMGVQLGKGMTATIGFWHNKNGQALINSLNGSLTSKALGNWLATTFKNIYGSTAGANNMTNKTNAQVAAFFMQLFNVKGMKVEAQCLAVALAVYATNSNLAGGTMASSYGFKVGTSGTGAATYNIGLYGAAFGVANNTSMSIIDILMAIDARSVNGKLYNGATTMLNMANIVLDGINNAGDIS